MAKRTCIIEGCGKPDKTGGYCGRHYENLRLRGNPTPRTEWPLEAQLRGIGWTVTASGCWEWGGKRNKYNYGRFSAKRLGITETMAHRVMYECFVEPIPDGLLVRHKCDNPPCVNPAHLLPGTDLDNVRDMMERGRSWAQRRTVCAKGHDLTLPGAVRPISGSRNACVRCYRTLHGMSDEIAPARQPKVSAAQKQEMRERRAAGETFASIGADYGVCGQYVGTICRSGPQEAA